MIIRHEKPDDIAAIRAMTKAAFAPVAYSSQTEAEIIDALRAAGVLTLSLVALADGKVVGHLAFSPVRMESGDKGWFCLGPVAVSPDCQGQGIGAAMIKAGLDEIKSMGAEGCVVLGDPAYYGRFGFKADPRVTYPGMEPQYFQILAFSAAVPVGAVTFHPGFDAT